eukprot:m.14290 g.14290  ORF g.14290 m.14290 type:complete len:58 (+) comp25667_c0_seq2:158-331(+)
MSSYTVMENRFSHKLRLYNLLPFVLPAITHEVLQPLRCSSIKDMAEIGTFSLPRVIP